MEILLGLICFGVMVMLIGHGMWLVAASLWRALFAAPKTEQASRRLDDLTATRGQLRRLRDRGAIDEGTFARVVAALDETPAVHATPVAPPTSPMLVIPPPSLPRMEPPPVPAVFETAPTPRTFAQVMVGFMEEKNIRWGELIGGLLIVFSSTALVVSLWSQIAAVAVLKFFLFTGVSAALFGVGLYTEHRWKLPTTSRGILTISTLLVPLNFLAIAAFSRGQAANDPLVIGGELVAFAVFLLLVWQAARVIVPLAPWLFTFGVLATSAVQLLIRRFGDRPLEDVSLVLMGGLPLLCGAVALGPMLWRASQWRAISRQRAMNLLTLFGLIGFASLLALGLLVGLGDQADRLVRLAPLVSLYPLPALLGGLLLWRLARGHGAALRTTGAAMAILSGVIIVLAAIFGLGENHDPGYVAWLYALYAVAVLWLGHRRNLPLLGWLGSLLLALALLQGLEFRLDIDHGWAHALLAHTVIAALFVLTPALRPSPLHEAMHLSARIAAAMAAFAFVLLWLLDEMHGPWWQAAVIAGVWFALALHQGDMRLFALSQIALTVAAAWLALRCLEGQSWFVPGRWLHPWAVQTMALAVAAVNLLWIAVRRWLQREHSGNLRGVREFLRPGRIGVDDVTTVLLGILAVAMSLLGVIPGLAREIDPPAQVAAWLSQCHGWGAWGLTGVVLLTIFLGAWERCRAAAVLGAVAVGWSVCPLLGALATDQGAAASAMRWALAGYLLLASALIMMQRRRLRLLYYAAVLLAGMTVAPLMMLTLPRCFDYFSGELTPSPEAGTLFARAGDAVSHVWPLLLAAAVLTRYATARWFRRNFRGWLYAAAPPALLAASTYWLMRAWPPSRISDDFDRFLPDILHVNAMALAAMALIGFYLEPRRLSREHSLPPLTRVARWSIGIVLMVTLSMALGNDLWRVELTSSRALQAFAWLALLALSLTLFREHSLSRAVRAMYLTGLFGIGVLLHTWPLEPAWLIWSAGLLLGAYVLLSGIIWRGAGGGEPWPWLVSFSLYLGLSALVVCVLVIWTFTAARLESSDTAVLVARLASAGAGFAAAAGLALLAMSARQRRPHDAALIVASLAALLMGRACLTPGSSADTLIHHLVIYMLVFAALVASIGFGLVKRLETPSLWRVSAQSLLPILVIAEIIMILAVVAVEVLQYFDQGRVQIALPAMIAVIVALLGAAGLALAFAMLPGLDPLRLEERRRMGYVYGAEAVLALLFAHVRVTMPWLFTGFFQQYWPLVVMAIAFLGVGLGEWLSRQRQSVLAAPLQRTGILLPLLPVLGLWIADTRVEYPALLVVVGLFYAALSILRSSFAFAVAAAVAGNAALWTLLWDKSHLGLVDHPQLWLIPPALSVLGAGHFTRDRLSAEQIAALRYTCLLVIYVSSTADIVIHGAAESFWLPLILMVLSVAGAMTGIMLRIQSFLYMSTTFLVIALGTIIRFAQVNLGWTWLWSVSGIVLGAAIIAIFALFEKKRATMLAALEELRRWEK